MKRAESANEKRQRTAALQDARANSGRCRHSDRFWTAAVLCRFGFSIALVLAPLPRMGGQTNNLFSQRIERDERRVHDPSTIVKCKDQYWLFSTASGISSRHSTNLINWSNGPRVFTN